MVKDMDPRCGLCVDIGHASEAGADVVAQIREAGPRVLDMHVKDMRDPRDMNTQVPVGDGVLPIPDIFRELIRMRYAGGVMLEYEIDPENPYPGHEKELRLHAPHVGTDQGVVSICVCVAGLRTEPSAT